MKSPDEEKGSHSVYISYFGLREPLVQRQVVPYLSEIQQGGHRTSLLTFERVPPRAWEPSVLDRQEEKLSRRRIRWLNLRYHKTPTLPATLFDILMGSIRVWWGSRQGHFDIVHCRGHVPMVMGTLVKKLAPVRLVFDIRGFVPEEYVDGGVWPEGGYLYRLAKMTEKRLLAAADALVVLTERAREHVLDEAPYIRQKGRPFAVIPCCVDLSDFPTPTPERVQEARARLGLDRRKVYVYVGQLGGWYLDDALVDFLARAREKDPSSFAMVLTPSPADSLRRELAARGYSETDCLLRSVDPEAVPEHLLAADVGLSFIKPCFSKTSSSPTKVGEYLAAGIPVVSTSGIGDLDKLLGRNGAGALLENLSEASYDDALERIDVVLCEPGLRGRLRRLAESELDLHRVGGHRYRELYDRLGSEGSL